MTRKHLSDDAGNGLSESRYVVDNTKDYDKFYLTRSHSWPGNKVYRGRFWGMWRRKQSKTSIK